MELPPFLTRGSLGEIRLTGRRIGLESLIWLHRDGTSAEEIATYFIHPIAESLVREVIAFYGEQREFVDAYMTETEATIERNRTAAGPPRLTMDELRRRFREKHGYEFPGVKVGSDESVRS